MPKQDKVITDDKEVVTIEERVTELETALTHLNTQLTGFAAWRRKVSENWKRFVQTGAVGPEMLEKGSDGKLKGFATPKVLVGALAAIMAITLIGLVSATVTITGTETDSYMSNGNTFRVDTNGDIYANGSITINGNVTSAQGVLSVTNLNAYGTNQVLTAASNAVGVAAGTAAAAINGAAITNLTAANIAPAGLTQIITNSLTTTNIITVVNGRITANTHTP